MDSHENRWAMDNALHHFTAPVPEVQAPGLSRHTFGMQDFQVDSAPQGTLPPSSCQTNLLHSNEVNTDNFPKYPTSSLSSSYPDCTMNTRPTEFSWNAEVVEPVSSNLLNLEDTGADIIQESLPSYQESSQLEPEAFQDDMSWTSDILSTDSQMNPDDQSFETHNKMRVEQREASLADELLFPDPITADSIEPCPTQNSSNISQQVSSLPQFSSPPADESVDTFKAAWQDADKIDSQLATNHQDSFVLGSDSLERDQQQVPGSPLHSEQFHCGSSTTSSQEPDMTTEIDMPEDPETLDREDVHMEDLSVPQKPSEIDASNIPSLGFPADLSFDPNNTYQHHTGNGKDGISNAITCTSNKVTESFSDEQIGTEQQQSEQVINSHCMLDEVESQVDKDQFLLQDRSVLECDKSEMINTITKSVQSQSNPDKENEQDVDGQCKDRLSQDACLLQSSESVVTQPAQIDRGISRESISSPSSVGSIMFLSDIEDQEATDEEQDKQNMGNSENPNDNCDRSLFKATEPDSTTCIGDEPSNEDPEDDRRCAPRMSGGLPGDDKASQGVDDVSRHTGDEESSEVGVETESGQNLKPHQGNETDTNQLELKMQCRENNEKTLSDTSDDTQNDSRSISNVDKETERDGEGMVEKKRTETIFDQSVPKDPEIKRAGPESLDNSTEEVRDLISDDDKEGHNGSEGDDNTFDGQDPDTSKQCESGNNNDQSHRKGSAKNQEVDADMLQERENLDDIQDSVANNKEKETIIQDREKTVDEHCESAHTDQDDVAKPQEGGNFAEHSESHAEGNRSKNTATGRNKDRDESKEPICLSDSDEEQRSGSVSLQNENQSTDSASKGSEDNQVAQTQNHVEGKESDSTFKGNKEDGQAESDDDVLVIEDDTPEVISVDDSSDEDDASMSQTTGTKNVKAANEGKKIAAKSDWSCQICGNSNKSLNSLKLHVRRSHNLIMVHRKEEMKCKMCSFTGTWQKIKEHIIKDHQTPLKWYVKNQGTTEITKLPASAPELPEDSLLAQPSSVDPKDNNEPSSSSGSNKQIYLIKKVSSIEGQKQTRGPGRPRLDKSHSQPSRVQTISKVKSTPAATVLRKNVQNYQQIAPRLSSVKPPPQPSNETTISTLQSTPIMSVLNRPITQNDQPVPPFRGPDTVIQDSSPPPVRTMTILTARPDTNVHDKRRAVINREISAKVREVFQQQCGVVPPLVTKISGTTYVISSTNTNALAGTKALPVTSASLPSSSPVPLHKNTAPQPQEAAKTASPQQGQTAFVVRNVSTKNPNVLSVTQPGVTPSCLNKAMSVPLVMPRPDIVANQQSANQQHLEMRASNALLNAATMSNVNPKPVPVVPALFNHEYCKRTMAPAVVNTQQWDTIKTSAVPRVVSSAQLTSLGPHVVHADNQAQFSRAKAANVTSTQSSVPITSSTMPKQPNSQKGATPAGPPMISYVIKVPKAQSINGSSKGDEDGHSFLVKVPVNQTNVSKKFMVHLPLDNKSTVKHAVCIVQPPLHASDPAATLPVVGKLLQSIPKTDSPSLVTDASQNTDSINNKIISLATSPLTQSLESRTSVNSPSCFVEPSELVVRRAQNTVPRVESMFKPAAGDPASRVSFLANLKEPALDIQLLKSQFEDTKTFKAADLIKIDERVQYECARCKESFPQLMLLQLHHIDCTTHPPAGKILPIVHIPTAMLASFFVISSSGYSSACTVCSTLLLGNARNVEDQQDFSSHLSKHAEPSVAITCLDDTRKLGILQTRMTSQQAKEWVDFIAPPFKMGNKPTSTQEGNLEEFINTTGILHQESMLLRRRSRRNLVAEHDKRHSKHKHKKHKHKHRHHRDHELTSREEENTPYKSSVKTLEGCEGEWIEPSPKGSSTLLVRKKSRPGALKQSIMSSPSQPKPQLHNLTQAVKKKNLTPSKVRQRFLNVSVPGRRSLRGMGLDFGLGLMMLPLEKKKKKGKSPNSEDRQAVSNQAAIAKSKSSSHLLDLKKDEVIEIFSSDEETVNTLPYEVQIKKGHTSSALPSPTNSQKRSLEEPDDRETKNFENPGELSVSEDDGDVDSDKEKMNVDGSDSKDANYSDNEEGEDSSSDDEANGNENRSNVDNSEREVESDGEATSPTDLPLTMIALHYQRVNKDIAISEMEDDNMECKPSTSNHSHGHETETIISEEVHNKLLEGTSSSQCQQASPCPSEVGPCISVDDPTCISGRSSSSINDGILLESDEEGKMPSLECQVAQTEQVVDVPPLRVRKMSGETESKSPSAETAVLDFDKPVSELSTMNDSGLRTVDRDLGEREGKQGHISNILEDKILGESGDVILEDTAQHGRSSQDSSPTNRSLDDVIHDDSTGQIENSRKDPSTRLDSSSGDSFPTKQCFNEDFQQEDSSRNSFQKVSDLEDSIPTHTSLIDNMVLDGSISPSSITEDNADECKISFEEGSIQLETSSEKELSRNSSQGDDFPQQGDSCEQESNSKSSFPSSRSLEDVPAEDASTNFFQEYSNSVDSFPTNKSLEGDFLSEDTSLNSFQQIGNFLDSSQESIPQEERGIDSFQLATSLPIHISPEQELPGTVDDTNHDNDIVGLNTTGDEITGDWILEDSASSTSNPDENNSLTNSSEAAARRSPLPCESISYDSIEEGGTPDVETNKSSTQNLKRKENTQNISKNCQNESPLAESNLDICNRVRRLSDGDNGQDIFLDNESKSSFGDGFDVEDWEEEEELSMDEVLHLSDNCEDDAAVLEDDPVEVKEVPLAASDSGSRLTGDTPVDINDDLTPMSNAIHSYLKTPQSMLHSGEEVGETAETEESQASQLNNLKRKSQSLRKGDATFKRSRVEGNNEGTSRTDL